jgi:hypothetical protein
MKARRFALAMLLLAATPAGPAQAARHKTAPPPAPSPSVKTAEVESPAAAPLTALPAGSWRQISRNHERLGLLQAESMTHVGDKAGVLVALSLWNPLQIGDLSGEVMLMRLEIDCKTGSVRQARSWLFGDDGKVRYDAGEMGEPGEIPPDGSNLAAVAAMACGTKAVPDKPVWLDPLAARRTWIAAGG